MGDIVEIHNERYRKIHSWLYVEIHSEGYEGNSRSQ